MKITVFLPAEGHPRHWRRIGRLRNVSDSLVVLGVVRNRFAVESPKPEIVLAQISDGRYFERIARFLRAVVPTRRAVRDCDLVYAFGLDMGWLVRVAALGIRYRLVLEIGDVRKIQLRRRTIGSAVRFLEASLLRRAEKIIVTSEGYFHGYMSEFHRSPPPQEKVLVMRNWPAGDPSLPEPVGRDSRANSGRITIGWFGLLRCPRSLRILSSWVGRDPENRELVLAGRIDVPGSLWLQLTEAASIVYLGEYQGLTQLPELYQRVDLVWAPYVLDTDAVGNWRWARTNRYFEGIHFSVPPITRSGTLDGDEAQALNLGPVLDFGRVDSTVVAQLEQIDPMCISAWQARCRVRSAEARHEAVAFERMLTRFGEPDDRG